MWGASKVIFASLQDYKDKSRCYECGEGGHLSYECPKNQVQAQPSYNIFFNLSVSLKVLKINCRSVWACIGRN